MIKFPPPPICTQPYLDKILQHLKSISLGRYNTAWPILTPTRSPSQATMMLEHAAVRRRRRRVRAVIVIAIVGQGQLGTLSKMACTVAVGHARCCQQVAGGFRTSCN